jgi:hypothetical protein
MPGVLPLLQNMTALSVIFYPLDHIILLVPDPIAVGAWIEQFDTSGNNAGMQTMVRSRRAAGCYDIQ